MGVARDAKLATAALGPPLRHIALAACLMLVAACAESAGKTNWQARIGHDSLDDIKRELGPPESCVGLDDGGTACSWTRSVGKDVIDKLILTFDQRQRLATADEVRL